MEWLGSVDGAYAGAPMWPGKNTQMNSIARVYSQVLGGVLVLIGVLGWIPPLNPGGALLGLFAVNTPHNLAHVLSGALGVVAGFGLSDRSVRVYTAVMSVIYGLLVIVGFAQITVLDQALALNLPDNLLHTAIFVLSLLICVAAFWEFRSLSRLQRLAPTLRRQRLAGAGANVGAGASSEIGPLVATPAAFGLRTASPALIGQRSAVAPGPGVTGDLRYAPLAPLEVLQERLTRLERETQQMKQALERLAPLEQQAQQVRQECETLREQVQTLQAVLNGPGRGRPSTPHIGSYPPQYPPLYPPSSPSSPQMPYLEQSQPPRQSQQSGPRPQGAPYGAYTPVPQRSPYRPAEDQHPGADAAWGFMEGDPSGPRETDDQGAPPPWSNTP